MTGEERDRLERAVDELRAFARAVPAEAEATRRRVLDAGSIARRARGLRGALLAAALLVFGGPALAQVTGQLPALVEAIADWAGAGKRGGEPRRAREREAGTGTGTGVGSGTGTGNGTGTGVGSGIGLGSGVGTGTGTGVGAEVGARARSRSRSADAPVAGRARALYLIAHRAHFGGTDSEGAIRAWDAFLRAAPGDPFAPEARYNRAILLMKLGRFAQAVEALAGFACAGPGSYRQREASALIARARAAQPELAAPACGGESP